MKASGSPLAFFHCDVAMNSDWRPAVEALQRVSQQRGIPFGMIYTGTFAESTDADWVNTVESYFADYETHGSPTPDQVIFQSWQPYPKHLLPETDPTTYTHLINRYFRTRTTMSSTISDSSVQGRLAIREASAPVANAVINAYAHPRAAPVRHRLFPAVYAQARRFEQKGDKPSGAGEPYQIGTASFRHLTPSALGFGLLSSRN